MSRHDIVVRGGLVVTTEGVERLDIGIDGGRVSALEPEIGGPAKEVIAADGLYILPEGTGLSEGLHESITPVRQAAVKVEATSGTEVLAGLIFPDSERSPTRFFFHEHSGPEGRIPPFYPGIASRATGSGRAIDIAVPLGPAAGYGSVDRPRGQPLHHPGRAMGGM